MWVKRTKLIAIYGRDNETAMTTPPPKVNHAFSPLLKHLHIPRNAFTLRSKVQSYFITFTFTDADEVFPALSLATARMLCVLPATFFGRVFQA